MTVFLFVCSIVLLMVGHALRLMRWSCFIKIYEHPPAGALLRSMALGYALNFFVPFKLGDVFRAYYSGKRMKNGIGFSLATVILDRFLDLIVVALLFAVLAFSNVGRDAARESARFYYIAAAAVLAVVIVAVCFLTNPRSERGSLVWAQKLNAADVASIELYVPAEGEARQYKKLDTEEMAQAVELINSSRGTYIEKPETVYAGLPVWFLLTMDDGTVHAVGSVVGHYLIIDGDTFDADVENQAEWENYVLKGDSASPIDMADRLSYALYGMTTGVYTLGEAVFEDSVWETSYEETFANTKSTPELWLSSALGTDMTGILYGTVTAARGYSYRFSEWEEIDLTETEYKILRLLMQSPQRIFPVQVIYEDVWQEPYFYTSNGTVMVHIRNLRMKVEHNPQNPQRICTVWGKGYRFAAQDISVRFVKENGKAGLAFENAVLPGQHRTDSTKVGLTSIETMMEKMHAACRIEQSGERFCITLLFPIALSVTPQA